MNTKLALTLLSLPLLVSACNSQDAAVTKKDPGGAAATPAPTQDNVMVSKNIPGSRLATPNSTVFLSLISTDLRGTPVAVAGLGFMPIGDSGRQPLAFHFDNRGLPYNSPVFVPTTGGVLFASQSSGRESTLGVFEPQTRSVRNLGSYSTPPIAYLSASDGLEAIAWSDIKGNAWLMDKDGKIPVQISLAGLKARQLQLSAATRELLVTALSENGEQFQLFSLDDPQNATLSQAGRGARLSPSGTRIAFFRDDAQGSKLFILDRPANSTTQVGANGEQIREATWKTDWELAYRSTAVGGSTTLHDLRLDTGTDSVIALLHFSDSLAADQNVVCPSWAPNGTLYFADTQDSAFVINQAVFDGTNWNVQLFAAPNDREDSGLICPQILTGSTL